MNQNTQIPKRTLRITERGIFWRVYEVEVDAGVADSDITSYDYGTPVDESYEPTSTEVETVATEDDDEAGENDA